MPEILIVKECFGIEQALHQLTALEYSCTAVQNREEASELLHHQMYDLVLLGMPFWKRDGWRRLQKIWSWPVPAM